ncbi:hypothetical protein O3P69_018480 [Scylla paramamosain]|uniref:DUF5641 domain-containing protein n=1 Tax=Scylla paramamosain TaxID=85552 RepID=A0AAW0T170_SCYPA
MKAAPGALEEEQDEELSAAMAIATVAALELQDSLTLDEDVVLQASRNDPMYQLLLARVLAGRCGSGNVRWRTTTTVVADRNVTSSRVPLAPGDRVLVQDHQHGRRWNRAGIVIEARDHRQYLVRLDGSGRISLRTRQHLRLAPEVPQASDTEDLAPPTPLPPLSPPSPAPQMDGEGRRARRPPRWLKGYVQ